jgi:hypothetical protein
VRGELDTFVFEKREIIRNHNGRPLIFWLRSTMGRRDFTVLAIYRPSFVYTKLYMNVFMKTDAGLVVIDLVALSKIFVFCFLLV